MSATASAAPARTGARADRLGAAIALAQRGFAVFPLRPGSKVPAVREDWEGRAVRDPQRLRELGWPDAGNIGIACGPSALFVLDLDVAKGLPGGGPRSGAQALRELAAGRPIPRTFTVATPSGGTHLYFRAPKGSRLRNSVARLGPLIDTRAAGGYVVAPGSVVGGRPYEIVDDAPVAPVPRWIARELAVRSRVAAASPPALRPGRGDVSGIPTALAAAYGAAALRNEVERMRAAKVGARNDTLNRAAYALGRLVGAGLLDRDLATSQLFQAARQAGLPARECAATLASGLGAGMARPRFPARRRPGTRSMAVRMLTVEPAPSRERRPADAASEAAQEASEATSSVGGQSSRERYESRISDALRAMDQAYDAAALNAAALVSSRDWRRIRALMDVLRDLRDGSRFTAARHRRAAHLCRAVGELAAALERTIREPDRRMPGRRRIRSPLGTALRELGRAADAAIDALADRAATTGAGKEAA